MRDISRNLSTTIIGAARRFGSVVVTGPRRSGKTWLLRHLFPSASYYLFEDPDIVGRFRADPTGFLNGVRTPTILDEIQNVPELFNHIRSRIDAAPRHKGQWLLTGSQESSLMRNVSESMAGRAAVLSLLPLSVTESPKVTLLSGGYPEAIAHPRSRNLWFSSYVQTYIERDVRGISVVHDLSLFRRFMALLATRHGTTLNKSDLAVPLGVSVPSIGHWLNILEMTGLIALIPPYFNNLGKRLVKSPKLYWLDCGLVCHLLGIESEAQLTRSPFLGPVFEGFVAAEILKSQINVGRRRELYYFRDQQGLEVDFVVPVSGGRVALIEAKATHSPNAGMAKPLISLSNAWAKARIESQLGDRLLVHRTSAKSAQLSSNALSPGVKAVGVVELIETLKK